MIDANKQSTMVKGTRLGTFADIDEMCARVEEGMVGGVGEGCG